MGPRIGATIVGIEVTLMTRPIRFGPAAVAIISIPTGISRPPPTPCSTRKSVSAATEVESPQATDPAVNAISATMYTLLGAEPPRRPAGERDHGGQRRACSR